MRVERLLLLLLAGAATLLPVASLAQEAPASESPTPPPPVLDEVKLIAQRAALAHLGGEKPFILRESSWSGEIEPGQAKLVQVQLFKRNDYHFWIAVPDRRAAIHLNLYDSKGELVEATAHRYESPNVASLVASPAETGVYYLRIAVEATAKEPQRWVVVYAYR